MKNNNSKLDKNKLEKISAGKNFEKLSKKKIFKKTGKIIANPIIFKNHDYFNEN